MSKFDKDSYDVSEVQTSAVVISMMYESPDAKKAESALGEAKSEYDVYLYTLGIYAGVAVERAGRREFDKYKSSWPESCAFMADKIIEHIIKDKTVPTDRQLENLAQRAVEYGRRWV